MSPTCSAAETVEYRLRTATAGHADSNGHQSLFQVLKYNPIISHEASELDKWQATSYVGVR